MRYSRWGYWGAAFAAITLAIIGVAFVVLGMPSGASWAKFEMLSAVAVLASAVALYAYRSADDIILSQHKTAWFWGSMVSLSFLGPVIIGVAWQLVPLPNVFLALARLPVSHVLAGAAREMPRPSAFQVGFIEGVVFLVIVQLVAFLLALAYLQLRRVKQ